MNPLSLVGAGLGLIGGIGQMFSRGKANKELGQLMNQDPSYQANPIAKERYGLAQTLLNSRMPGSASMERNIYQNQANTIGNVQRNATDSSQALALAAGTQGQTNQAFNQLGMEEANDYQRRYGNLVGAQEGMINEGDKVYNDSVRRYGDKVQIKGAQQQNRMDNWQTLSNMGFGLGDFGLSSGFGANMFKKGGSGGGYNVMQPNVDAQMYQLQHQYGISPSQIISNRP